MEADLINNLKLLHQVIVIKFPEGGLERCAYSSIAFHIFFKRHDILLNPVITKLLEFTN